MALMLLVIGTLRAGVCVIPNGNSGSNPNSNREPEDALD